MGSDFSSFSVMKDIGNGSASTIELVTDRQGAVFATKTILKTDKTRLASSVKREIKAGQRLKGHPGIAAAMQSSEDKTCVRMLMEYVHGKNLKQIQRQRNGLPMEEAAVKALMEQLVDAMDHMHSKGVAHRDIKLANIMLATDGKAKLIDFGMSQTTWSARCTDHVGTFEFCAPEVLDRKKTYNGYAADVWSLGVVLYALLYGQMPFGSEDFREMKTAANVSLCFPKSKVTEAAQDLLRQMLQLDPSRRITVKQMAMHDWLSY